MVNVEDNSGVLGEHEVIDDPLSVGSKFIGPVWVGIHDGHGILVPKVAQMPKSLIALALAPLLS